MADPNNKTSGNNSDDESVFMSNNFDGGENSSADLDADLQKLQAERDLLFQQLARVQADFRNAQKRLETEKQMQVQFANSQFMKSLLPVIDNFERALDVDPARTDTATVIKGLKIAYDQLQAILKSNHVEIISPAAGEAFDPNLHQAIMQQPNDQYAEPTVTQLFQKGYAMHGRPLRPAQVAVSKVG